MISAMLLVASAAAATTLEETWDRSFDVRPGALFALENTNGHITIRSWDQARIRVIGHKKVESRDADVARQAMAALKIEAVPSADGLRVTTNYPKKNDGGFFDWLSGTNVSMNVEYDIAVPRTMDLNIDNTNGSIDISDVKGTLQVSNTNGHIECARCAGSMEAETTNGSIRAELTAVTPGKKISLETTNGRVAVTVPRSIGATVDASTTNGSINTDLPITSNQMSRHAVRGTVNGGGAELRLRSTNGSIEIMTK
jgi:Putative adhesin